MNTQNFLFNKIINFKNFLLVITAVITTLNSVNYAFADNTSHQQHHDSKNMNHDHHEKQLDITSHSSIPTVKIDAYSDNVKGWNLEIKTENFEFISPQIKESNPNKGHAHIYINGEKVGRIYSNWYYIPKLPQGKNKIKVTLNTNNHEDLLYKNQIIGSEIIIENP